MNKRKRTHRQAKHYCATFAQIGPYEPKIEAPKETSYFGHEKVATVAFLPHSVTQEKQQKD